MFSHWKRYPPVAVSAAAFLGIKGEAPREDPHELEAWISRMPLMVDRPRAGATERARARAAGLI